MTFEVALKIFLGVALLATVGALVLGLFHMFRDGKEASEKSNKMMRWRIVFQAIAILIFSVLLFLKAH